MTAEQTEYDTITKAIWSFTSDVELNCEAECCLERLRKRADEAERELKTLDRACRIAAEETSKALIRADEAEGERDGLHRLLRKAEDRYAEMEISLKTILTAHRKRADEAEREVARLREVIKGAANDTETIFKQGPMRRIYEVNATLVAALTPEDTP